MDSRKFMGNPEKPEKQEQIGQLEQPEQSENMEQQEQLGQSEPSVKQEQMGQSEPSVKQEQMGQSEPSVKREQMGQSEPSVKQEQMRQSEPSVKREQMGQSEPSVKQEQTGQSEPPVMQKQMGQSELPEQPELPDMYEITRVEQHVKKAGRYDLYLNGQYAYTVHEDTLVALHLLKGTRLKQADLVRLEREERMFEALDKAVRWIGRRPHSSQEVERKLRQMELDDEVLASVMDRLRRQQLLDDRLFAEQWTESRIRMQKKGRHWVRHELMQKGVAKDDIEAALHAVDPETEYDHALQLGMKKWQQSKGEVRVRKQKTAAYLMRRGFPSELVRKVVNECAAGERDEEEMDWPE